MNKIKINTKKLTSPMYAVRDGWITDGNMALKKEGLITFDNPLIDEKFQNSDTFCYTYNYSTGKYEENSSVPNIVMILPKIKATHTIGITPYIKEVHGKLLNRVLQQDETNLIVEIKEIYYKDIISKLDYTEIRQEDTTSPICFYNKDELVFILMPFSRKDTDVIPVKLSRIL